MSIQSEQIFDKMNQNKTNLVNQDLLTITLIAFCVFMRSVKYFKTPSFRFGF